MICSLCTFMIYLDVLVKTRIYSMIFQQTLNTLREPLMLNQR